MLLDILSVEFKNFLCFGNIWQKVELKEGLNLVIGKRDNSPSSNASGKSSWISAILFGLYGKTDKDVNKDQIPNWKNKKNCEVKITFQKGPDIFTIHRGINPTILKLYKNNEEEQQISHNRDFQAELEKSVLGMDYETFLSIAHYNATQSQSIFNVSKGTKRAFLEKIFGLEIYTDLANRCNNKASSTNIQLSNVQQEIIFSERSIKDLENQINNFKNEIKELQENDLEEKYKRLHIKLTEIEQKEKEKQSKLSKLQEKEEKIDKKLIELDEQKAEKEKKCYGLSQSIANIQIKQLDFDEKVFNTLCQKKIQLENTQEPDLEKSKQLSLTITSAEKILNTLKRELAELQGMLKAIPEHSDKSATECPLCGNYVKKGHINEHLEKKKSKCVDEITKKKKLIEEQQNELDILYKEREVISNEILVFNNAQNELQKIELQIEKQLKDKEEVEINEENIRKKESISTEITEYKEKIKNITIDIQKYKKMLNLILQQKEELQVAKESSADIQAALNKLELQKITQKEQKEKFNKFISENENKIDNFHATIQDLQKQEKKFKNILDYLEFVKKLCKDDGVRTYAIQHTVPFLTQRINKYLADAGVNFYLKLDSNFNVEVRGTGIVNASFGSLSSGQQKVTNIATLLAFQDLYKLRSPLCPNILLLDEVLDSAIDSHTLTQIMNIIQEKQRAEHLKCYVVSHRKEISEVTAFDNIIQVNNKSGFATIVEVG